MSSSSTSAPRSTRPPTRWPIPPTSRRPSLTVLAVELAPHRIRVNSVHPTNVDTDMIQNPAMYSLFAGVPDADQDTAAAAMKGMHALPIPWVDPVDISNAVVWLASDDARYVTGVALPVDGGMTAPFKLPHAAG